MKWLSRSSDSLGRHLPGFTLEETTRGKGLGHQGGALIEDSAGPQGIVADLAIAHVSFAWHPDSAAMGQERGGRATGGEGVEGRGLGSPDCVGGISSTDSDAVHDAHDDGPFDTLKLGLSLEFEVHDPISLHPPFRD